MTLHRNGMMGDSYRPDYGPSKGSRARPNGPKTPMYHFQGNKSAQSNDKRRPPSDFTFRRPQPRISERPLLTIRQKSPENVQSIMPGDASTKFRDISEMTDSEAEEMDLSDVENETPANKRVKLDDSSTTQTKWSNPDPYTALPAAIDEPARKRTDVVKLIRKSRVAATSSENTDMVQTNADFISFDFGDTVVGPPPNAPTGPRAEARKNDSPPRKRKRAMDDEATQAFLIRGVTFYGDAAITEEWRAIPSQDPTPWFQQPVESGLQVPLMSLHNEILDFYHWVKPHDFEHAVRSEIIGRVHEALKRLEPGSDLQAFGSFAAGLYLPTADMDLVLLTREHLASRRTGFPPPKKSNSYYYRIARLLENAGIPTSRCVVIPKAKVPIVKFVDKVSGIKVDLSFDNDTGINANKTFQVWKTKYPELPIIVSVIKQFLMIRGLNDNAAGGLGGFSTICLVTSIMQHLPPTGGPPNLGRILVEFFNLYGNLFNRRELGIRMEPPGYFFKREYKPFVFNPPKENRLSIIDPNNLENDISGGSHNVDIVFKAFAIAYQKLTKQMESLASGRSQPCTTLGDLIGGNYVKYAEQRDRLRRVFETTYKHHYPSFNMVPPPPSLRPPPPEVRALASVLPTSASKKLPADFPKASPDLQDTVIQTSQRKRRTGNQKSSTPATTKQNVESASEHEAVSAEPTNPQTGSSSANAKSLTDLFTELLSLDTSSKHERLARRMKVLRPDLPGVPLKLTLQQAVKLGKYAHADALREDLNLRQGALVTLKRKKKTGPDRFPELVEVRRVLETLQKTGQLPANTPDTIRTAFSEPAKE